MSQPSTAKKHGEPFKLKEYFALISLAGIIVLVVVLSLFYRHIAISNMIAHETRADVDLAQTLSNSVWPEVADFVNSASTLSTPALRDHPETAQLHQRITSLLRGLNVIKVKIYNLEGLTVFSTEAKQIGDDKSNNPGFISAKAGKATSELTFRDQFSAFEGAIVNRHVLSPYIPIQKGAGEPVEGVFEIYSDVTELVEAINKTQWQITLGVLSSLLILYVFLALIIMRADRIIKQQQIALRDNLGLLEEANKHILTANHHLDERVHERTLELREALEHVQAANKAKSHFLATMSHEIRTPMNGMLGILELMANANKDKEAIKLLATAQDCGQHLLSIINDILDFSKIESGKLVLENTPFSLRDSIGDTLELMAVNAQKKGLDMEANFDLAMPATLRGDPGRVRQVLTNLVGNAIKFTDAGKVSVNVERTQPDAFNGDEEIPLEAEQCWLRFTVTDTGCGIAPEAQPQLFEVFTQADSSFGRKYEGTGLGLAISKQLVECMGGNIGFSSTPNQGSQFWFSLPLAIAPDAEAATDNAASNPDHPTPHQQTAHSAHTSSNQRLLLVEDNPINQMVTSNLLTILGYEHDVAENGFVAVSLLEQQSYALILMDCQMPEMDGFEATKRIREKETATSTHIPILAVTANALTGDRERCLAVGMDDFLAKPFSKKQLCDLLANWYNKDVAA